MCLCVCVCMCMLTEARGPRFLTAGVPGVCVPADVGAGIRTVLLIIRRQVLLTSEPAL